VIDPLVSLAFSLHANRGAYGLLLGSGVSRAAGVPTGWEVVLDLARRVAELGEKDVGGDPAGWYREEYGEELDYSKLLEALAREPAERNRLLRSYFEPNDEERAQGLKVPTLAHRAIARLVGDGYVRVIVTTNFDRLLENALADEGVVPIVIATPDAVLGALPLSHTECAIVKIHGDYLDARIRNTPTELAAYEQPLDDLLDRVFDEYGLVVCGWSAEWDPALRDAISRCASHRFTTYWAFRGEPNEMARELLALRRGVAVPIVDADSFFVELEEKVAALARLDAPHPLSSRVAAETLKRYLPDEQQRIRLHDLVFDEVARVEAATTDADFPMRGEAPTPETVISCLERYEATCTTLVKMLAVGGYWGDPNHRELWVGILDRLVNRWIELSGVEIWIKLRQYPAILALYALGLGAVAAGKLNTLAAVLGGVERREFGRRKPLVQAIPVADVVPEQALQPGGPRHYTPASERLCDVVLREPLREFLAHDDRYTDAFDKFEYLISLAYADAAERRGNLWAPAGSFGWRQRRRDDNVYIEVEHEARAEGASWGFLAGGLFGGSLDRFFEIKTAFDAMMRQLPW
jgi:hypothetical protein